MLVALLGFVPLGINERISYTYTHRRPGRKSQSSWPTIAQEWLGPLKKKQTKTKKKNGKPIKSRDRPLNQGSVRSLDSKVP